MVLMLALALQGATGCGADGIFGWETGPDCNCPPPSPPPAFPPDGVYLRTSATDREEAKRFAQYFHASTLTTDVKMQVSGRSIVITYMYGTTQVTEKWRVRDRW